MRESGRPSRRSEILSGSPSGRRSFRKWRPAGVDDRFRLDEDYIVGHLNRMAPEGAENRYTKDWLRSKLDLGFGGLDDPGLVRRRDYLKSLYRGELAYADAEIGRFTDRMAKTGILGRSVFVLTGDHGEAFHEHVNWGHGETVYVEEAAVPLVFHVPGPEGPIKNVVADPVSLADVFPSVLDLMDLPSPGGLDGRSLVPWMRSSERETPERGSGPYRDLTELGRCRERGPGRPESDAGSSSERETPLSGLRLDEGSS